MSTNYIYKLIEQYYEEFAGLPNERPIVRNNIIEDAFTLAILKVMYSRTLELEIHPDNISNISRLIIAPPDSGIDIFVEIEDGDECFYDIIQAKYQDLTEGQLRSCFIEMKDTVKRYLKSPDSVQTNLKSVISETSFSESFKDNCRYYVFHRGKTCYGESFKSDEIVITTDGMEVLQASLINDDPEQVLKVPYAEFTSDMFNNYILYENSADENGMLCNIRGYDLADLCNRYVSSSMGRNILFGQNLREVIDQKKSKTFAAMEKTIDEEPDRFWNYNNGISIICEELDAERKVVKEGKEEKVSVDLIKLSNFSIINGAQTTNALGVYLQNALIHNDQDAIERLKRVYVLVRIMQVNNDDFRDNISIYNNLQNPITSKDMVANNYEQKKLQTILMNGEAPHIFVKIRTGQRIPPAPRFEKHQQISNEVLAQTAFAAFLQSPYRAKEKKKNLFNKDMSSTEFLLNQDYDDLFYLVDGEEKKGVLFKKTKEEIDEALFVKYLYSQAKNLQRKYYNEQIIQCKNREPANPEARAQQERMLQLYQRNKEVNNTCMFYCIYLYFVLKDNYSDPSSRYTFDYFKFYRDNRNTTYRKDIINYFAKNFLEKTVSIMGSLLQQSGIGVPTNWLRKKQSQEDFREALSEKMALGDSYQEMYKNFIRTFAVQL